MNINTSKMRPRRASTAAIRNFLRSVLLDVMQKKRRAAALWQALHHGIKFNSPDSINRSQLGNRTG